MTKGIKGFQKGHKQFNTGRTHFKKGQHPCPEKEFKKGHKRNTGKPRFDMKGKNHWNWQGGISPLHNEIRQSIEYKIWRDAVYKRDYWTCQICGKKPKNIVAHHIFNFVDYPHLRFAIDNGKTLCRRCHLELHKSIRRMVE